MNKITDFLERYTLGFFTAISNYCKWAESQSKNQKDLLLLTIGPIGLMALFVLMLPGWIGKLLLATLTIPFLFILYALFTRK